MSFCHGYLNNKTWIGNLDFLSNCLLFSCFRLLLVLVKECEIWYIFYIFHFAYCRCIGKILLLKLDWYNFFYDLISSWVLWICLVVLRNLRHLMFLNLLNRYFKVSLAFDDLAKMFWPTRMNFFKRKPSKRKLILNPS